MSLRPFTLIVLLLALALPGHSTAQVEADSPPTNLSAPPISDEFACPTATDVALNPNMTLSIDTCTNGGAGYLWVVRFYLSAGGFVDVIQLNLPENFDANLPTSYVPTDPPILAICSFLVDLATDQLTYDCEVPVATVDSDGDRLVDSVETDTGVYVSPTNTGTDPNNPDTDGDSIRDGDEVLGTTGGLDLPAMGANPLRKTVLIEYDWFDDSNDCGFHTHRPNAAISNRAAAAFANAPVPNPDGSMGIDFIQDYGQGGAFTQGNLIADANGVLVGGVNSAEFANYKNANFANNREDYFHYTILPHRYNTSSGSSGQAELPGDDLIVSLQCFNTTTNVSNTIVHEIGHNFLLRHGGFENCNYKPNYNSVMNYEYQFPGVDGNCTPPGDGILNYSLGDRITLNENSLNEFNGVCGVGFPWDWNGNTVLENGIVFDVNPPNPSCSSTFSILNDHDDWANLLYSGVDDADLTVQEVIECTNTPGE